MSDEAMRRLLDFDRRRYWLINGWSIRFRIAEIEASTERPHGIKYSFSCMIRTEAGCWALTTRTAYRARRRTTTGTASDAQSSSSHMNFGVPTN